MADVTITQLPTYATGVTPGPNDAVPIVDLATNTTRKVPFSAFGGGGGGGSFTGTALWTTANATSKNAYTNQPAVNNDGITINLVASSGSGSITAAKVSLNGTQLSGTYSSSGSFPNYVLLVPMADLLNNPAEVAPVVNIAVTGTFNGSNINVANAGTLTNVQPIPFTTVLSGNYAVASVAYYVATATLNYSYTNSAQITSFGGVFTPTNTPLLPQNATSPSGSFPNVDIGGAAISGSATGNGLNGGAQGRVVALTGSVPPLSTYVPAFYQQTPNATPPTFNTGSTQTAGAAQGSLITYPVASATSQFNWICTQRPLANLLLVTTFGNSPLVPDAGVSPLITQTIAGQVFNVYGWSSLTIGSASVLQIT